MKIFTISHGLFGWIRTLSGVMVSWKRLALEKLWLQRSKLTGDSLKTTSLVICFWKEHESDHIDSTFLKTDAKYLAVAGNKTKMISWIVSNCKSTHRQKLVEKLQTFVDVDIYGKCGNLTCAEKSIFRIQCFKQYKFYLSFENTLCADYVTEKVYKVMNDLVVPVVFNGADMNRFLPPMSYIDANSFETVEDLAIYLKFLSDNPKEYVKYFWWKKHYQVLNWYQNDLPNICKKVRFFQSKRKSYKDIQSWFSEGSIEPKIKF
jgi:alpha-1,3-fucosyltransferase